MFGKLKVWYLAVRPHTLSAAVVPVLVGLALVLTDGSIDILLAVLTLIACLLVQMATNLVDEYSDHDRPEGKLKMVAPYKVIALGLLSRKAVKMGAIVCLGIAFLIGVYIVLVTGWPILLICLVSVIAVYFYSAGPKPLGSMGLGQPIVFMLMGPAIVLGTYYVQTQVFTMDAFLVSLSLGCTVTAIMAANDIRDIEEDKMAGKNTIGTAFGFRIALREYILLIAAAFVIVVVLVAVGKIHPLSLISLLAVLQAIRAVRYLRNGRSRQEMASGLRATSALHWYFGLLLVIGIGVGSFL
jgi:1,4-dihydroxy-2-naphthoate polyprenyltransferase